MFYQETSFIIEYNRFHTCVSSRGRLFGISCKLLCVRLTPPLFTGRSFGSSSSSLLAINKALR